MKRVYWRPQKISKAALFAIGLVAVGGTLAIEHFPITHHSGDVQTKMVAAQLADRGMKTIRAARVALGHEFAPRFDPTDSGMIGAAMSQVTSLPGHLDAKQTSVNPNFAAVATELLQRAGVGEGDLVAVGCTGSFPGLNTCLYAALEAIGATPLIVHSAASSQFGANEPDMMWLDMERVLYEAGIISFRSQVATLGGFGDRARGMSDDSVALLTASLERNGVDAIGIRSLKQSVEQRMEIYRTSAAGRPVTAYVNVGGGAASIHGEDGREAFGSGLTVSLPSGAEQIDCVATRYAQQGIPIVNLGNAVALAKAHGLPVAPQVMPAVGQGAVFTAARPSRLLAALLLMGVLGLVRSYVWTDLWARVKQRFTLLSATTDEQTLRLYQTPQGAELMV